MPKVPLRVLNNTNRIVAPDFCPYAVRDIDQRQALGVTLASISPIICSVCKICTFIPSIDTPLEFSVQEKDKCKEYLTRFNTMLSSIINRQISYLMNKGRSPLAILITANVLENILGYSVDNKERRDTLFHYFVAEESSLGDIYGCPIYFSRKLTLSVIQVVGETEWK